jgi:transcription termination/antitermination protein NusA
MATGISANKLELLQIADAVAREKGIEVEIVLSAMADAIQKAAKARYGAENDIRHQFKDWRNAFAARRSSGRIGRK